MIGLVVVTHGRLADEFVAAMEHVVGPQTSVRTVCIGPEDDMEKRRNDIQKAVLEVNTGAGAIILTDMFGGTPCNLAMSLLDMGRVEVIAGINLPMLIKLADMRTKDNMVAAVTAAQDAGRNYIKVGSALLKESA